MFLDTVKWPRDAALGYFDQQAVETAVDRDIKGIAGYDPPLWDLVVLELWHTAITGTSAVRADSIRRRDDPRAG